MDGTPVAFVVALDTPDQVGYVVFLFLYAIAAAVILPIPFEQFLFLHLEIDPIVKAIVVGLGKGAGAIAVFYIGYKVNPWLDGWMSRRKWWGKLLKALEGFIRRTGWVGLLVLLSIPFMSDTAVNYLYALLNEEGRAVTRTTFVAANVAGGIVRTLVILWIPGLFLGP